MVLCIMPAFSLCKRDKSLEGSSMICEDISGDHCYIIVSATFGGELKRPGSVTVNSLLPTLKKLLLQTNITHSNLIKFIILIGNLLSAGVVASTNPFHFMWWQTETNKDNSADRVVVVRGVGPKETFPFIVFSYANMYLYTLSCWLHGGQSFDIA